MIITWLITIYHCVRTPWPITESHCHTLLDQLIRATEPAVHWLLCDCAIFMTREAARNMSHPDIAVYHQKFSPSLHLGECIKEQHFEWAWNLSQNEKNPANRSYSMNDDVVIIRTISSLLPWPAIISPSWCPHHYLHPMRSLPGTAVLPLLVSLRRNWYCMDTNSSIMSACKLNCPTSVPPN